ncbi:hypothetical protein AB1N83_014178 [Pleurotus pulmonarius]
MPRQPHLWSRLPSRILAALSPRPMVIINNTTATLVASDVGNGTTVKMEKIANNNPSTTHVRGNVENTYYSDVVYEAQMVRM